MKVRIHLDGSQTITGTAAECAEFMGLRDQQCEWPEPAPREVKLNLGGFDSVNLPRVQQHEPPPPLRIFKVPDRSVSLTGLELLDILAGGRPEGLSDRDHAAAKAEARRLRIIGAI
jgi:hypothetical protein